MISRNYSLFRRWQGRDPLITIPTIVVALVAMLLTITTVIDAPEARAAGFPIGGKILEEYNQAGGSGFFGDATTREADAARGGKFQKFYKNSSIYWHPNVSGGHANSIGGSIRDKWGALNFENGPLRYPSSRELGTRTGNARFNRFEGGNVYWTSAYGAHPVWGAILQKWASLDYEVGPLGLPTGDEYAAKDGGRGQAFEGGRIYWSANTGAHTIYGLIGENWADANFENGPYGYPTSDEYADTNYDKGRRQDFQVGYIQATDMTVPLSGYSDPSTNARQAPPAPTPSTTGRQQAPNRPRHRRALSRPRHLAALRTLPSQPLPGLPQVDHPQHRLLRPAQRPRQPGTATMTDCRLAPTQREGAYG